jgi:hypothetical protein
MKTDRLIEWMESYQGGPLEKGDKAKVFVEETKKAIESLKIAPACVLHEIVKNVKDKDEAVIIDEKFLRKLRPDLYNE